MMESRTHKWHGFTRNDGIAHLFVPSGTNEGYSLVSLSMHSTLFSIIIPRNSDEFQYF